MEIIKGTGSVLRPTTVQSCISRPLSSTFKILHISKKNWFFSKFFFCKNFFLKNLTLFYVTFKSVHFKKTVARFLFLVCTFCFDLYWKHHNFERNENCATVFLNERNLSDFSFSIMKFWITLSNERLMWQFCDQLLSWVVKFKNNLWLFLLLWIKEN